MSIADWLALDPEAQKQLWLDKLNDVKNDPNISTAQATLVSNLIDAINNMGKGVFAMNTTVQDLGMSLAQHFSEVDFTGAFVSLEPYALSGVNTPTCSVCYDNIQNQLPPVSSSTILPDCNCDWTCGDPLASSSCRNSLGVQDCCREVIGCGFLLLGTCNGRDSLF